MVSRRAIWTLSIAGALCALLATAAYAAAPMVKTQAPGYYRIMLGDFEVTALSDGTAALPVDTMLTNTTPGKVRRALARAYLKPPVETSVNAFLINTGSKLLLVDAGAGALFGPTVGKLMANLKASGYQPEQVDEIYITHMHADHVGGLMVDGKIAFPNATVHADKRDADFWLSQANMDSASKEMKDFFTGAMQSINPYIAAGKFQTFDRDGVLTPGLKAVLAHGHTPGHTTYLVESKGQALSLWGDLIHVAAVQFEHPSVTIQFDSDPKAAIAARKKAAADAAKNAYLVGAAHIAFPGLGYVRRSGFDYAWVPVNYGPVN